MKITLSEKQDMWFLLGTSVHLSFENRGPVEVDMDSLRPEQRQQILWSLQRGVITSDTSIATPQAVITPKAYAAPVIIPAPEVTTAKNPAEALDERKTKLKTALAQNYNTFKKNLKNYNVADLRLMKELETAGKARKSTLDLLDQGISKHQSEVMSQIAKEDIVKGPDQKRMLGAGLKVDWSNIEDVVESELEDVEIQLGADADA